MQLQQLGLVVVTTGYLLGMLFLLSRMIYWYGVVPLVSVMTFPRFNLLPYYVLLFPGTVLHEFSHWLGCKITLVPVLEFVPFSPQKDGTLGWVKHRRAGPVRGEIISFAPLVGGMVSLYALSWLLLPDMHRIIGTATFLGPGDLGAVAYDLMSILFTLVGQIEFRAWNTWLFLYLAFAIGRGMVPSTADLVHLAFDLLVISAVALTIVVLDSWLQLNLASQWLVGLLAGKAISLVVALNFLLVFTVVAVSLGALVLIPICTGIQALGRAR